MLNLIVYSKDRGCQLELLLRSLKKFFKEWDLCNIHILYKFSNDKFREGYDRTISIHSEFKFIIEKENAFKSHTLSFIDTTIPYTMFLVDDIVFKEAFSMDSIEMKTFMDRKDVACLSLRMCPRLNYCYTMRINSPPPIFIDGMLWKWEGLKGDWGYTNSLDGSIYKTSEIFPVISSINYNNPNTFEGTWACYPPQDRPYMICFSESKIVNNPLNKVQDVNGNYCGGVSVEYLNDKYIEGNIINLNTFIGLNNISAHQEVPISFIKGD